MSLTLCRYWSFFENEIFIDDFANETLTNITNETTTCHAYDVLFIKTYLIGFNGILVFSLLMLFVMVYYSAQGSIIDIKARRFVAPLLYLK